MRVRAPIIVLGCHRSGTSAVSEILDELGVFVGWRLDQNHEALFFLRANMWLFAAAGGRWDRPAPMLELLADPDARDRCEALVHRRLRSWRALEFLGLSRWLRYRAIDRLPSPWSFKDPRATFTLPLWLDLFPDAKVIHVHRHGVDVAHSLWRRHRKVVGERARDSGPHRQGSSDSTRCATLQGAFSLWEEYVFQARRHVETAGEQALEFAYEEMALDPTGVIARLAEFCELEVDVEQCARAAALVRSERASAHTRDPALAEFAATVAGRVDALRAPSPSPSGCGVGSR